MKKIIRPVWLLILALLATAAFTGCQTAHGFGEDMEAAGHEIQKGTQ